ncbi:MAG: hypothetical protein V4437_01230 [Patescibacteria group bacterium]
MGKLHKRRRDHATRKEIVGNRFIPPTNKVGLLESTQNIRGHILGIQSQLRSEDFKKGFSDWGSYLKWRFKAQLSLVGYRRELALLRVSAKSFGVPEIKINLR